MPNELILAKNHLPITSGGLDQYIQQVNTIPMLTAEEEQELGDRLVRLGDLEAAQRLVMSHLRFVVRIARF